MTNAVQQAKRMLAHELAHEVSFEELQYVSGGACGGVQTVTVTAKKGSGEPDRYPTPGDCKPI